MTASKKDTGLVAIVPVKRFAHAKQRLAGVLSQSERSALAKAMLEDVLEQIAGTRCFTRTLVVGCEPTLGKIVAEFGAELLLDPIERGINQAVAAGFSDVRATTPESAVTVIPGDLPFLTASELGRVGTALEASPVVLVPAAQDGGTNLLALARPDLLRPGFGLGSFRKHLGIATAQGLKPAVLRLPGAGHDIDTPDDLTFDPAMAPGRRSAPLLRAAAERMADETLQRAAS